jgi:hypothetical protein
MRIVKTNGPGGYLEQVAQAPSNVSGLLGALETRSQLTPTQMKQKLGQLEQELSMVRSRDISNPQMAFRRATGDKYGNLSSINPEVQSEAEKFYNDAISKLKSQAYVQTAGNRNDTSAPMYKSGDLERAMRNAGMIR